MGYRHGNRAMISINGTKYINGGGRGLNIVTLDGSTHKKVFGASYDTYGDGRASGRLASDMHNKSRFPDNCIVIVAAKDEASR